MNRLPMFLAASFTLTIAGAAFAADTRSPTTTDEARSSAAQRHGDASVPAFSSGCVGIPTSTDEARAAAGAQSAADAAATSRTAVTVRTNRSPSSTDEARALVAARTSPPFVTSVPRHEEVCASCACKRGEQHARATVDPCGCHERT